MDLATITDPKELKALAYDQLAIKQQAEHNLQAIQMRMVQIEQEKTGKLKEK